MSVLIRQYHKYTLQKLSWFSPAVILRMNIQIFTYGQNHLFIYALARNQLASQRLSVYLLVTTRVPVCGISFKYGSLLLSVDIFQFRTKLGKNTKYLTWRPSRDSASISNIKRIILSDRKIVQNKVTEKPNTYFTVHILFLKSQGFLGILKSKEVPDL